MQYFGLRFTFSPVSRQKLARLRSPSAHQIPRFCLSVPTDTQPLLTFLYSVLFRTLTGPHGTATVTRLHTSIIRHAMPAAWGRRRESVAVVAEVTIRSRVLLPAEPRSGEYTYGQRK